MTPFDRIGIQVGYETRFLMMAICRQLKAQYGSDITLYTHAEDGKAAFEPFVEQGDIDRIVMADHLTAHLFENNLETDAVFAAARRFEKRLGQNYNLARMARRDLGLGFYLGGSGHPESRISRKPTYVQTVHAYNKAFDFWFDEFERRRLGLFINGTKEVGFVADALNVPYRFLYSSRVENYYYWAVDDKMTFPGVEPAFRKLEGQPFAPFEMASQYLQDRLQKAARRKSTALSRYLRKSATLLYGNAVRRLRYGANVRQYDTGSYFSYLTNEYRDTRRLSPAKTVSLKQLEGRKFLYFPLHTEPEMSLHWMSPECFTQHAVIASLARDLPADVIIGVKETVYGLGRRPRGFYDQLERMKNVVIIDPEEPGVDTVKSCAAVATMAGTAGLEGAIIGKPVVMFGRHTYYDYLDHVAVVDMATPIPDILADILSDHPSLFDIEKAKSDGARLRQAIINASFDLGGYNNLDLNSFDAQVVLNAVGALSRDFDAKMFEKVA